MNIAAKVKLQNEKLQAQLVEAQQIIDRYRQLNESQTQQIHQRNHQHQKDQHHIDYLNERIALLLQHRFGTRSEKIVDPNQLNLFNEAELLQASADAEEQDDEWITVKRRKPKRGHRSPLPDHLPRHRVEHDLSESQKICPCCGDALTRIDEETTEQLEIVPAKIYVTQHVQFKYACRGCEDHIKTASKPPQPIAKALVSASLLAYIIVSKYVDALPLYRQEKIFERLQVFLSRTSMARWVVQASELIEPLIQMIFGQLLSGPLVQSDESNFQVLKEPGRAAQSQSHLWVMRGGPPEQPVACYHYDPGRGHEVLEDLLDGYQGYLQCDGWSAYNAFETRQKGVQLVGCMAHARRYFYECIKAKKESKTTQAIMHSSKADQAIRKIKELYVIEKHCKTMTDQQRHTYRQEHSVPKLDALRQWVEQTLPGVPPKCLLGKALHYMNNQWHKLIRYTEQGYIPIDNNADERQVKQYVIGRKNWLFADTQKGAHASAKLYTLLQTAKANGLEPFQYLVHVFTELPKIANNPEQIKSLLPWNISSKLLSKKSPEQHSSLAA